MLLFSALSGPIAFATFVGDRADIRGAIPLFNLVLIVLFGGAIGLLAGGTLDSWLINPPSPTNIWWVGPIEESAKLILPVALYIFGHQKYRSVRAGLGLASAAGFAVMETMGYGLNEILKTGALFTTEAPLQAADRLVVAKNMVAGAKTPITRGILVPFGHLVWTGLITTVWWSEWKKRGGIGITRWVIGAYVLAMFLHSANDFFPLILAKTESGNLTTILSFVGIVVIAATSFVLFWRTVKKRVPMQKRT